MKKRTLLYFRVQPSRERLVPQSPFYFVPKIGDVRYVNVFKIGDPDQLVSGETEAGGAGSGSATPWGRPSTTGSEHVRN